MSEPVQDPVATLETNPVSALTIFQNSVPPERLSTLVGGLGRIPRGMAIAPVITAFRFFSFLRRSMAALYPMLEEMRSVTNCEVWFRKVLPTIRMPIRKKLEQAIETNSGIYFAPTPLLFWEGLVRDRNFYQVPNKIENKLSRERMSTNLSYNEPAVTAFKIVGGTLPYCSSARTAFHVHHIYDGQFGTSLHATKNHRHFTQTAGLVALEPELHKITESCAVFAWYLRCKTFQIHAYDPDGIFSGLKSDEYGFVGGHKTKVFFSDSGSARKIPLNFRKFS